jgi:tripartite-type tricarboxylate transporter receptor subunit TctC
MRQLARTAILAAIAATAWPPRPAMAQELAGKTITLVVPFAPGAVSDPMARAIAPRLGDILGTNVIVENRAGANTNLGTVHVVRSPPDGRTLLLAGTALIVNVAIYKEKLPFDPLKDLKPVSLVATTNSALVVHPSLDVATLPQLIALLKSRPGEFNYASAGSGNMTHLAMEFFKIRTGTNVTHVPYKGANPALNDVLAGHVPMMIISPGPIETHVKAGRLRALAITGLKRFDLLPDVPTFTEMGLPMPEVDHGTTFGILAPAGISEQVLARLNAALGQVLSDADLRARMKSMGFEAAPTTPQEYEAILRTQSEKWPPLIEQAGITLN